MIGKEIECEVSVIVLTYNASINSILATLKSIIKQKQCSFEIIISDDGSERFPGTIVEQFFIDNQFTRYMIIRNNENVGTVRNLESALGVCHGKYIKSIGQGDILYDEITLHDLYIYAEKTCAEVVISDAVPFSIKENRLEILKEPIVPFNIKCYKKGKKAIKKYYLLCCDCASGAAVFLKRTVVLEYIKYIKNRVMLAEDLMLRLMVYDERDIVFLERNTVFYEVGIGISWIDKGKNLMSKDEEGISELLFEKMTDSDSHFKRSMILRNEMLVKMDMLSKFRYILSDINILLFQIRKKFFPRRLKMVEGYFLRECENIN